MTRVKALPKELTLKTSFSRKEFISSMEREYCMTGPQISYDLQKRLDECSIVRIGWDNYSMAGRKNLYKHKYSVAAEEAVREIEDNYTGLLFQVFELIQLNDFMNHQIAHNTIFVSVEKELQESVFDAFRRKYPGRVMLRPSVDEYYRYLQDNEIVVCRLPSESPKGFEDPWKSRLEKIIVDVFTDKLISRIVPEVEKEAILLGAVETYLLDRKTMLRYARRKGSDARIRKILNKYGVTEDDNQGQLF